MGVLDLLFAICYHQYRTLTTTADGDKITMNTFHYTMGWFGVTATILFTGFFLQVIIPAIFEVTYGSAWHLVYTIFTGTLLILLTAVLGIKMVERPIINC